jgi:hypothetical protein
LYALSKDKKNGFLSFFFQINIQGQETERNTLKEYKKSLIFKLLSLFSLLMSTSSPQIDSDSLSETIKSSDKIRQKVDDRHWQLFETRLKNSSSPNRKENYTKSNNYRIIDRFKKFDQPQLPIEPDQRWKIFCSQLTNKSNETNRLMSIFHNVWIKNWNTTQDQPKTKLISNENNFFKHLSPNEHDKKKISSILHQNI